MKIVSLLFPILWSSLTTLSFAAPIETIWLTHATNLPDKIVVNWQTDAPRNSAVEFGNSRELGKTMQSAEMTTLHHVEIPLALRGQPYYYRVRSGDDVSEIFSFKGTPKGTPGDELRIVIVGDWGGGGKDVSAIVADDIHLLITTGDNVANLHGKEKQGTKAYRALIDDNRALFRTTPFMPVLGNHDRELTPRGPKPLAHAVYDIEASAYREFFALPGDEWKWFFDLPEFDLRFIALDLNHLTDFGTTWQTCHAWQPDSAQFKWYSKTMASTTSAFVFTLMNEKQTTVNDLTKGAWDEHFRRGSALITGFGYFADRAELTGELPYFNTCLKGDGDLYLDPNSQFHSQGGNYLLLTVKAGAPTMTVQFKNLRGEVLDTTNIPKRIKTKRHD